MSSALTKIQQGLFELRYNPGPIDGLWGPKTEAAVRLLLTRRAAPLTAVVTPSPDLPWMTRAKAVLGRHEVRDNAFLKTWLKSDGKTLGDPAKLPWCGDFVETCIKLALPGETLPGALGQNPYWARNWLLFGKKTFPTYGCVVVFARGSGGHVGFAVGQDATAYHVLGGNQSNTVSYTRVAKSQYLGSRWPSTYPLPTATLPQMKASGQLYDNKG